MAWEGWTHQHHSLAFPFLLLPQHLPSSSGHIFPTTPSPDRLTAHIPISLPKAATPLVQSKCQNLGAANQFSQQKVPVKLTGSSAELQSARAWGTRRQISLNKGCRNTEPANYHLTRFTSNSTIRILWEVFKWNFSQGNRNSGHQINHHLWGLCCYTF